MRMMNNGFVEITIVKYGETTQILVKRDVPAQAIVFALTNREVREFVSKLKEESRA